MNIVVYQINTGQIIKSISCPENMIEIQYDNETQAYIEHERVDDSKFKVDLETLEIIPIP